MKKLKAFKKRIVAMALASVTIASGFLTTPLDAQAAETETVKVSVTNKPKIDIMLSSTAKAIAGMDMDNFEGDVLAALQSKGVDTSDIEFQTVDRDYIQADKADFAEVVNSWTTIGAPIWTAQTETVDGVQQGIIYGNVTGGYPDDLSGAGSVNRGLTGFSHWSDLNRPGYTADWTTAILNPAAFDTGKIDASFESEANGNLNNGFMFMVQQNGDKISGYGFNVVNHVGYYRYSNPTTPLIYNVASIGGINSGVGYGTYGLTLYRFDDVDFDNTWYGNWWCAYNAYSVPGASLTLTNAGWGGSGKITALAQWNVARKPNYWNKWHVTASNGNIKITLVDYTGVERTVANVRDTTYLNGTYGFWGNNCERQAGMKLTNFVIRTEKIKTYAQVLDEPTWRDNSKHVVVNINDEDDATLTDPKVIAQTLDNNINYVFWGAKKNQKSAEAFVNVQNDGNGIFTLYKTSDGSSYQKAVENTATYIKKLIEQEASSQYVVVGNQVNVQVTPDYLKTGAVSSDFENGRWYVDHDYTYYANNMGQSNSTNSYTPDLLCVFDKPGKYDVKFDDEVVKTVYAHRLPVADFTIGLNGNNVSLTSSSYDEDSDVDKGLGKGIAAEKWEYKKVSDSSWTEGKLSTWTNRSDAYMIRLTVTDEQGATADAVKYLGTGKPVAGFNVEKSTVTTYGKIKTTDTSYDPSGDKIVAWNWEVRVGSYVKTTSKEQNPVFDGSALGVGDYKLVLTVTNSNGLTSEAFSRQISVTADTEMPSVTITPLNCDWKTGTQDINLIFTDSDSGVKQYRTAFTTSQSLAKSGWSEYTQATTGTVTTPSESAQYYLSVEAVDNAGNKLTKVVGPYRIDNTAPAVSKVDKKLNAEKGTMTLTIKATDTHSGIKTYGISTSDDVNAAEWGANVNKTVNDNGVYYVFAKDAVGNISSAFAVEVTELTVAYTVIHQQEQLDGSYVTVDTDNLVYNIGKTVTPDVKDYTGFTTPEKTSIKLNVDASKNVVTYKYTLNHYNVKYNLNGGNAGGNPTYVSYNDTFTLKAPTKEGRTFLGWSVTGMDYTKHVIDGKVTSDNFIDYTDLNPSATFKNLSSIDGATVVFTAVWDDDSYVSPKEGGFNGDSEITNNAFSWNLVGVDPEEEQQKLEDEIKNGLSTIFNTNESNVLK